MVHCAIKVLILFNLLIYVFVVDGGIFPIVVTFNLLILYIFYL